MAEEKIKQLEGIGIVWDVYENQWNMHFSLLGDFVKEMGRFPKRKGSFRGKNLAGWVAMQRQVYNAGKLDKEKTKQLEDMGIVWGVYENKWNLKFSLLRDFIKEKGRFPKRKESFLGKDLGGWVAKQRHLYNAGKLDKEKINQLEGMGMVWDVHENKWNMYIALLGDFIKEKGRFPKHEESFRGVVLGTWVATQRAAYKAGKLDKERVGQLKKLGVLE